MQPLQNAGWRVWGCEVVLRDGTEEGPNSPCHQGSSINGAVLDGRPDGQKLLFDVCVKGQKHRQFVPQQRVGQASKQPVQPPSQCLHTSKAGAVAMDQKACGHGGKGSILHGRIGEGLTLALELTPVNPTGPSAKKPNWAGVPVPGREGKQAKYDEERKLVYTLFSRKH